MLYILEDLRQKGHSLLREYADLANQASDSSGCECASAEAEEEYFIAWPVVCCYKGVALTDIFA